MKARRNGLIEIARFIFAFFILFYHKLFVVELPVFANANYFVDFFFLLIGFFLLKSFERYEDKKVVKSTLSLIFDKFKKIGIPFFIAYGFNLANCLLTEPIQIKFHFLWFVHIMFIAIVLYFLLYRVLKQNKKYFAIAMGVVLVVTLVMRNIPACYYYDELRGLSMISYGVLLSLLPSIKFKNDSSKLKISIIVVVASAILIGLSVYLSSLSLTSKKVVEMIADLILFPSFIIFALNIKFKSRICDVLGLSSDFIYIYQVILIFIIDRGIKNMYAVDAILLGMVAITVFILRLYYFKKEKALEQKSK